MLLDDLVANDYAKKMSLEVNPTTYDPENFGFGFAKDKYPELLADFNAELQAMLDDGTVEAIMLEWMNK